MVRQAERALLGRMPLTATAYPLRVHHERPFMFYPRTLYDKISSIVVFAPNPAPL